MAQPSKAAERIYMHRVIAGAGLFGAISQEDIEELVRCARSLAVQRGKPVAPPKGKDEEIYVIESGAAALLDFDFDAEKRILVALLGPGDVIGFVRAAEVLGGRPAGHNSEWRALSNLTLVAIPLADFLRVLRRSPELSGAMLAHLAGALRETTARFTLALQAPLEMRLAAFFSELAGIATGNSWEPDVNIGRLQQTLIADMLGVSREHVNRTLIMWEKSGLIFQVKNGDILIEDRKRLLKLAGSRRANGAAPVDNEWLWAVKTHLDHGLYEAAHDLAMEGVKRAPRDDRFKYFAALAIARMGALTEALSLVESFKLSTSAPNEDIASIGPRLRRDLAFAKERGPDLNLLNRAAEGYEAVYRALKATYPGVNAAATYAMGGDMTRARSLAREVGALAAAELEDIDEDEPSYWPRATLAECRLIKGDLAGAAAGFSAAVDAVDAAPGMIATTRKQLRRLKPAIGIDDVWIDDAAPQLDVLYFCGPRTPAGDAARAPLERLEARIGDLLEERSFVGAVGALAAGADIVIAEQLLEANVPLHVHLPLAPAEFLASSVAPSGGDWRERFIACIERAQTVEWTRRTKASRAAYRLGSRIAIGRAIRRAESLETDAFAVIALQRGRTASNSVSHESADIWRARGLRCDCIEDDWVETTAGPKEGGAQAYRAALIVDQPDFVLPDRLAGDKTRFAVHEGGIKIFAFDFAGEAAGAAAALLRSGEGAKMRIWLDIGIADDGSQAGRAAFPAALSTASCRPQTTPGKAYASESFVNAAAAQPAGRLRFEYIGIAPTEEKLEPCPLFLVDL